MLKIYALIFMFIPISMNTLYAQDNTSLLNNGLKALEKSNISNAINIAHKLPNKSLEAYILNWAISITNLKGTPSSQIATSLKCLYNWPKYDVMKINYEKALYDEITQKSYRQFPNLKQLISHRDAQYYVKYFNKNTPKTAKGMAIYLSSAIITNNTTTAKSVAIKLWKHKPLSTTEQKIIIKNSGNLIDTKAHQYRLKMLLLHKRYNSARQISYIIKVSALTNNFIDIMKNHSHVKNRLSKLAKQDNYGILYQYAYISTLYHNDQYVDAATQLISLEKSSTDLIDTDIWNNLKISIARDLVNSSDPKLSYKLVFSSTKETPNAATKRELYAAWIALRLLHKPHATLTHLSNILKYSKTKKTLSMVNYWRARAYEEMKRPNLAKTYYRKSAKLSSNFYAQLSSAKVTPNKINIKTPTISADDKKKLNQLIAMKAIKLLYQIGDKQYSRILSFALADHLSNESQMALLSSMAFSHKDYFAAVRIAKIATAKGYNMGAYTHPLGIFNINVPIKDKSLLYAIARQESEFNPTAVSRTGARGMLQIMPSTAKEFSKKLLQKFSLKKLTNNLNYNTKIGYVLLKNQLSRFNGSYILTLCSYNAGANRTMQWVVKYGDPRKMNLKEAIDWIINIPYSETRNYVIKVLENFEFYQYIMMGKCNINADILAH